MAKQMCYHRILTFPLKSLGSSWDFPRKTCRGVVELQPGFPWLHPAAAPRLRVNGNESASARASGLRPGLHQGLLEGLALAAKKITAAIACWRPQRQGFSHQKWCAIMWFFVGFNMDSYGYRSVLTHPERLVPRAKPPEKDVLGNWSELFWSWYAFSKDASIV